MKFQTTLRAANSVHFTHMKNEIPNNSILWRNVIHLTSSCRSTVEITLVQDGVPNVITPSQISRALHKAD